MNSQMSEVPWEQPTRTTMGFNLAVHFANFDELQNNRHAIGNEPAH